MRWLWSLFLVCACARLDEAGPDQAALRQAYVGSPTLQGTDGGRLGSSVASCRGGTFGAGAPGVGSAALQSGAGFAPGAPDNLGLAVACDVVPAQHILLSGGTGGLAVLVGTSPTWLSAAPTFALARSENPTLPLLVGESGAVRFLGPGLMEVRVPFTGSGGFGKVLAWYPASARFAVGSPAARRVDLYDFLPDAGVQHSLEPAIINSGATNFGTVIAIGDVSWQPGVEVIIGSSGAVWIYQEDGVLIQTLARDGGPSFGAALAVDPQWAPGLDALWIGEPLIDTVHHFVGDSGTPDQLIPGGARFGASLSFDSQRVLAIGAPATNSNQGAVFIKSVPSILSAGAVGECDVTIPCEAPGCMRGTCTGGVFCGALTFKCGTGQFCDTGSGVDVCVGGVDAGPFDAGLLDAGLFDAGFIDAGFIDAGFIDAGFIDAGFIDAGLSSDAGLRDAGLSDAGLRDAGLSDAGSSDAGQREDAGAAFDAGADPSEPIRYGTCGCSTGAWVPSLILGLALSRRFRVRRSRGSGSLEHHPEP